MVEASLQAGTASHQQEGLAQSDTGHRVGRAISTGLHGVQDIEKLLMRQPSVHQPMRARPLVPAPTNPSRPSAEDLSWEAAVSEGLQSPQSTSLSLTAAARPELDSTTFLGESANIAALQQGLIRQVSRLQQGSSKHASGTKPGNSPSPVLQLSLPGASTASNSLEGPRYPSALLQPILAASTADDGNVQQQVPHTTHALLSAAQLPAQQCSASTGVQAALNPLTDSQSGVAVSSLARARSSRGSSGVAKASSVSFLPAVTTHHMGASSDMPKSGNGQSSSQFSAMQSSNSSVRLARYSSTLAAAVGETMQDRMVAGGMMQSQEGSFAGSADRCDWIKADPVDRCSWPRRAVEADRCSWPSSISKEADVQRGLRSSMDDMGMTAGGAGETSGDIMFSSGKSMPTQLGKHRSNSDKASKRPEFAAAMKAIRESWIAEQQNRTLANNAVQTPEPETEALHPPSFDTVWQTISHYA